MGEVGLVKVAEGEVLVAALPLLLLLLLPLLLLPMALLGKPATPPPPPHPPLLQKVHGALYNFNVLVAQGAMDARQELGAQGAQKGGIEQVRAILQRQPWQGAQAVLHPPQQQYGIV